MDLSPLVAPLRADVVSGASTVSRASAGVIRRVLDRAPRDGVEPFRRLVGELVVEILDAQPAMAPLVALGTRVVAASAEAEAEEDARRAVRETCSSFLDELESADRAISDAARELLPDGCQVLTLSASSTVRRALVRAARDAPLSVTCLESRPVSEGRRLARRLAAEGVPVVYAVDAAVSALVPECDAVLMGADSVGDRGVVNKIGSASAALAARDADVPVYVLADSTKLLPPGFPQPVDDDRPGEEVWRGPPGVRVWNRYFERVKLSLVTGVVTEEGILEPDRVRSRRSAMPVPEPLAAWARSRSTG